MINAIAERYGLSLARTGSDRTIKLSDVIKQLVNDHFCHTSCLSLLERYRIIRDYAEIDVDATNPAKSYQRIVDATLKIDSVGLVLVSHYASQDRVTLVSAYHSSSFSELQRSIFNELRQDDARLDEFLEEIDGVYDVNQIDLAN